MSEEVERYDGHRIDDLFYAYTALFLRSSFLDVCWAKSYYEPNFKRMEAFPIDLVHEFMERLLQKHGKGPLLHTIIAVNLECEPMPSNGGRFTIATKNPDNTYRMKNNFVGLIAACGIDTRRAFNSEFECMRCQKSIKKPGRLLSVYECLRLHVNDCEMSIDQRYFEPLTDFYRNHDRNEYLNFLNKTVAETVLTKMGVLVIRSRRRDNLPYSVHKSQRRMSLDVVLRWRKRPRLHDDELNRIVEAGYHAFPNLKRMGWREMIETLRNFTGRPMSENKIKCFSCHHVATVNANFVSDPWRYHAKKSPNCRFLKLKMGMDYIRQVRESMYDFRLRNKMELPAAVIDPQTNLQPRTTPLGPSIFDLCEVITDRKPTEGQVAVSATTVSECVICCIELRAVALMACLHIATCVDCSFAIRDCPLCRETITGYIKPAFQPDGSFWKQSGCVGGNYSMNLPCRHLIESCVPNNVYKCPKAWAVEEDKIYCVVCGNANMGKLKVYL